MRGITESCNNYGFYILLKDELNRIMFIGDLNENDKRGCGDELGKLLFTEKQIVTVLDFWVPEKRVNY